MNAAKWKSVKQALACRHISLPGKKCCISVIQELDHLATKWTGSFSGNVKHETFLEKTQTKPNQTNPKPRSMHTPKKPKTNKLLTEKTAIKWI